MTSHALGLHFSRPNSGLKSFIHTRSTLPELASAFVGRRKVLGGLGHGRQTVRSVECGAATELRSRVGSDAAIFVRESRAGVKIEGGGEKVSEGSEWDLSTLFPDEHLPRFSLLLALYFPLGCVIASFRMCLWILLLAVDLPALSDNDFIIDVLLWVLGVRVEWHSTHLLPEERCVLVSNHQSTGDLLMLYKLPRHTVHLITPAVPKAATKVKNHRLRLRHATPDNYSQLADPALAESVHLFPEGGMTNGAGMMQFTRGFMRFAKDLPVVPVALRVSHAFDDSLNTHTLTSSFLANLFFFCFPPRVHLDATVLDPMRPGSEGNAAFVQKVQGRIAGELRVPILGFGIKHKKEMMKKVLAGPKKV